MKYALILGLTLMVFWLWRKARKTSTDRKKPPHQRQKQASLEKATEVVACRVCHVHLPKTDALTGSLGLYCCAEHRQQAGD